MQTFFGAGQKNTTINWNGSSDFITCFLCARSCCINWGPCKRRCSDIRLTARAMPVRMPTETRMSAHLILEVCLIVHPRFRGSHTKLISADAYTARLVILHVQCWEPRGLWERSERARQKLLNFLPSSRSYFTQFTIWVVGSTRRHLSTLISCFPQLFTLFPKIRLLILSPAPYTHASSLALIQFVSRVIIALFLSGCCCTFLSFGL